MFKVGDRVAWASFKNLPLEDQKGYKWDGPRLKPEGYKVLSVDGEVLLVETNLGIPQHDYDYNFVKVSGNKRNLPEWF